MQVKYGNGRFDWSSSFPMWLGGCGLWKGISEDTDVFFSHVKFKVNKGHRIKFLANVWYSREPLKVLFPSYYILATSKEGTVQKHMIRSRAFCSSDLKPKKNLNDWEIKEIGRLMDILKRYQVGDPDKEDDLIWIRDEDRGFLVLKFFDSIESVMFCVEVVMGLCSSYG